MHCSPVQFRGLSASSSMPGAGLLIALLLNWTLLTLYPTFLCLFTNVVDSKSVYVKNVSRYFNEVDLEIEFNRFGRVAPDGVAIRSHKVFCMDIKKFLSSPYFYLDQIGLLQILQYVWQMAGSPLWRSLACIIDAWAPLSVSLHEWETSVIYQFLVHLCINWNREDGQEYYFNKRWVGVVCQVGGSAETWLVSECS